MISINTFHSHTKWLHLHLSL